MKVAVLALGPVTRDTAGRTYLSGLLGPLGAEQGLDVEVHLTDANFAVPETCTAVHHRLPARLGPVARIAAEGAIAFSLRPPASDVLLAPFNFLPVTWRGPSVVVQHNVLSLAEAASANPDVSFLRAVYRPRALAATLRRATAVVVVSDYLRGLLLERYPDLAPSRVHVVPHGVDEAWVSAASKTASHANGRRVLVVSALWRYKRVDQAIEAFAKATREMPDAKLQIVGPGTAAQRSPLEALARQCGVANRVEFLGYVPHDELGTLYARAHALLYLSDLESFGLPVVEAMAFGVPVVAKRIGGVAEVAGDAPFWVGAASGTDEIAAALTDALADSEARDERIRRGKERAARFTWRETAHRTARVLRSAADAAAPVVAGVRRAASPPSRAR